MSSPTTDRQEAAGKHGSSLYTASLVIMIGLLVVGFVANELVRPVNVRHHIPAQREASDVTERQQSA